MIALLLNQAKDGDAPGDSPFTEKTSVTHEELGRYWKTTGTAGGGMKPG